MSTRARTLLPLLAAFGCSAPATSARPIASPGLQVEAITTTLAEGMVIRWPRVVSARREVAAAINQALAFEAITGETLAATQRRIAAGLLTGGVDAADFTVTANTRGVLSIAIAYEWIGPYPTTNFAYLNFDAATGARLEISDLLDRPALPAIAARLDTALRGRIAAARADHATEVATGEVDASVWDDLHVTADSLAQFTTTPAGITFHWDAGFPHALLALAPDSEFPVATAELAPHVNPRGPWAER